MLAYSHFCERLKLKLFFYYLMTVSQCFFKSCQFSCQNQSSPKKSTAELHVKTMADSAKLYHVMKIYYFCTVLIQS